MGGFFGAVSNAPCVEEIYYGTDYHTHLGTRRGGMAMSVEDGVTFVGRSDVNPNAGARA